MVLSRTRLLYIGAVLVSGIVIGFLIRLNPEWQHMAVPPAARPFAASFVIDLVIQQMAARGRAEPITMADRFVAVMGAALIVAGMAAL